MTASVPKTARTIAPRATRLGRDSPGIRSKRARRLTRSPSRSLGPRLARLGVGVLEVAGVGLGAGAVAEAVHGLLAAADEVEAQPAAAGVAVGHHAGPGLAEQLDVAAVGAE